MNVKNIFGDKPWKRRLTYANLLYTVGIIIAGPAWPLVLIDKIRGTNDLARIISSLPQDEEDGLLEEVELIIMMLDDIFEETSDPVLIETIGGAHAWLKGAKNHLRDLKESNSEGISLNEIMDERHGV